MASLTNKQLQHLFAQDDADATNYRTTGSKSLTQRGNTLYSYSTPIAKWHRAADGSKLLLVTSPGYSTTTKTKHISGLSMAAYPYPVFFVEFIGAEGGQAPWQPDDWHQRNLGAMLEGYRERVARLGRKRDEPGEWEGEQLTSLAGAIQKYAAAFGRLVPELDAEGDFSRALAAWREKDATRNTPEMIAKRAVERAQRKAREEAAEAVRLENERILAQEQIAQWKAGQRVALGNGAYRLPTQLRLKDAETVQTSHGAEVPLRHAVRLFHACQHAHETCAAVEISMRIGAFTLNGIDEHGNATVGCHHLLYSVMEDFAREIGVLAQKAS